MKTPGAVLISATCLGAIAITGIVMGGPNTAAQTPTIKIGLDPRFKDYRSWHKVNEKRVLMDPIVATLCTTPKQYSKLNPHVSKYITVYVNETGRTAMLSKEPTTFPGGSIIIKEKYGREADGQSEMITIMVKREKGFSSSVGDWEFVSAETENAVYKNVDLSHCISCHQQRPDSDYVFRSYLPKD
jgi:hypothetical protein